MSTNGQATARFHRYAEVGRDMIRWGRMTAQDRDEYIRSLSDTEAVRCLLAATVDLLAAINSQNGAILNLLIMRGDRPAPPEDGGDAVADGLLASLTGSTIRVDSSLIERARGKLSIRAINALVKLAGRRLDQVRMADIRELRNCGETTANELANWLAAQGIPIRGRGE